MQSRFSAFVLGNSNYKNVTSFPALPHCNRDATEVFSALTDKPTGIFNASTSKCRFDLSHEELLKEINGFFAPIKKTDTVLMYFACHGRSFGQRHFALVMTNTEDGNLAGTGFDVGLLGTYLAERQIKSYILIFDCCRAGKVLDIPGLRLRGVTGEINLDHLSGMGRWLVASCLDYQNANELEALQHGLFTHYLIEGIRSGKAVTTDSEFIDVQSVCTFVSAAIAKDHGQIGQDPIYSGEDLKGSPVYIARNPTFKKRFSGERVLLDSLVRILKISDLSDEVQFELARKDKLQNFVKLIPSRVDIAPLKPLIALYGEALGLDERVVAEELSDVEARIRFEAGRLTPPDAGFQTVPHGLAAIFSAEAAQQAFSLAGKGSVFGHHFLQAIAGGAADEMGLVTVRSAFDFIRRRMSEDLREINITQGPELYCAGEMIEFALTGRGTDLSRSKSKRRALLVATDQYADPILPPLWGEEASMEQAAELLSSTGNFEVSLLRGNLATRANVTHQLMRLRHESGSDDCVLFYFAGHAVGNFRPRPGKCLQTA